MGGEPGITQIQAEKEERDWRREGTQKKKKGDNEGHRTHSVTEKRGQVLRHWHVSMPGREERKTGGDGATKENEDRFDGKGHPHPHRRRRRRGVIPAVLMNLAWTLVPEMHTCVRLPCVYSFFVLQQQH